MLQSTKARRIDRPSKKCITGPRWDLDIPSDLLHEILSRLGLKANIQASVVCKAWCEAAVSVRKLQPRPWLLYPLERFGYTSRRGITDRKTPTETYLLYDTMRGQIYKQDFPDLGCHEFLCYKDGWLLTSKRDFPVSLFFLDPFTRERVYLPWKDYQCIAFSAARTLASCLVVSILSANIWSGFKIKTCRPGETKWTSHRYPTNRPGHLEWSKCVFSNGMFYCLSTCGHLGVFDPTRAAWNILPVKPCPAFLSQTGLARLRETRLLVMEHEGDVYVISTSKKASVFKLDLKRKVWEEKRELGGLTVFASQPTSLTRAGLLRERNRIYPSHEAHKGVYYNLADDKYSSHRPPVMNYLSDRIAWVDPPLNEANLSPYDGINY